MQVMLEAFLLLNGCMNAALLCATLRWCGKRIRGWRVALAAAIGAVYAALAYMTGGSWSQSIPCSALVCALMLWVAARWERPRHLLRAVALFWGMAFLLGGSVFALAQASSGLALGWKLAMAAGIALVLALRQGIRRAYAARAQVRICLGAQSVEFEGMVDSGNLLRDPINGLPVLIAPQVALRALLPDACDPARLETLPQGFRLVHVTSSGGARLLMCFRPSKLSLREQNEWRDVCAMVAITPDPLPEGAVALIPLALISA